MNGLRLMPDAELMVVRFLRDHPDMVDLIDGRVHPAVPATPTFPLIVVQRVSGVQAVKRHLDAPEIQLDSWSGTRDEGGSKFEARVVAASAMAALLTMLGIQDDLGVVTGVDEVLGPWWNPDPRTIRPKYTASVVVFTHPLPAWLAGS